MYYWPLISFITYVTTLMWFFCGISTLVVCRFFGFSLPFSIFGDDDDSDEEGDDVGVVGVGVGQAIVQDELEGGPPGADNAGRL